MPPTRGALVAVAMIVLVPAAHAALWTPGFYQPNLATMTGNDLYDVSFRTPLEAVAVGQGFTVYATEDGGLTWTRVFPPQDLIGFGFRAVTWAGDGELWAGGQNAIFQSFVAHSVDGGANWEGASFYIDGNEGSVRDIAFADGRLLAVFLYWFGAGGIIESFDGGENWTELQFSDQPLLSMDVVGDRIVVAGGDGDIYVSEDAGHTWAGAVTPTAELLWGVDLVDDGVGYAAGSTGTILRTDDGGHTWTALASGTQQVLYDVAFATPRLGYAVGEGGTIVRTIDGGATWTPEVSGVSTPFLAADAALDAALARTLAVGDLGTIRTGIDVAR